MQEAVAAGTWAQSGAGCFLDILPLTEGAPVERCRVGAAPAPFLPATPTAGAADGPLRPRGPAPVHWPDREGLGSGSGGFLRHAGPREGQEAKGLALGVSGLLPAGRKPHILYPSLGKCQGGGLSCGSQGTSTWNPAPQGQLPDDLPLPALGGLRLCGSTSHSGDRDWVPNKDDWLCSSAPPLVLRCAPHSQRPTTCPISLPRCTSSLLPSQAAVRAAWPLRHALPS